MTRVSIEDSHFHPMFFILIVKDLLWLYDILLTNFVWFPKVHTFIVSKDFKDHQQLLSLTILNLSNHQFIFIYEQELFLVELISTPTYSLHHVAL